MGNPSSLDEETVYPSISSKLANYYNYFLLLILVRSYIQRLCSQIFATVNKTMSVSFAYFISSLLNDLFNISYFTCFTQSCFCFTINLITCFETVIKCCILLCRFKTDSLSVLSFFKRSCTIYYFFLFLSLLRCDAVLEET